MKILRTIKGKVCKVSKHAPGNYRALKQLYLNKLVRPNPVNKHNSS